MYFLYGTSPSSLTQKAYYLDGITTENGSFNVSVSGLLPNTTYYYRAVIENYNGYEYVDVQGEVMSFTTAAYSQVGKGYLGCYEIPALVLSGTGTSGTNSSKGDKWFNYGTVSSSQVVATHTFTTGGDQIRNYTVLYDKDRHAPLWAAFPMHASVYDGTTSRDDSWAYDPAVTPTSVQQTGLDDATTVGYSRGHFVASSYRKGGDDMNNQTFYYTNQAPQWQNGFNSGVWSTLEDKVRAASPTASSDTLYVVVGVLYEGTTKTLPSGSINVPIPSHFYKCLMKCSFNGSGTMTAAKGIAYVYTNESHTGESYYASSYVTTIDAIESRAGFDFFSNVPKTLQDAAEGTATPLWTY